MGTDSTEHLLGRARLLQLVSPSLPIGGFTYSQGLEWAVEAGWRCIQVVGPLDLSLVGILASLAAALAEAGVSLFVISTYDTDYVLVKEGDLALARQALEGAGHVFEP